MTTRRGFLRGVLATVAGTIAAPVSILKLDRLVRAAGLVKQTPWVDVRDYERLDIRAPGDDWIFAVWGGKGGWYRTLGEAVHAISAEKSPEAEAIYIIDALKVTCIGLGPESERPRIDYGPQ